MSTNKKLIRAFAANFGHKMLMMFQLCQVMVMISFSSSITLLASDQLHPAEGKNNLASYLIINCPSTVLCFHSNISSDQISEVLQVYSKSFKVLSKSFKVRSDQIRPFYLIINFSFFFFFFVHKHHHL